MKSLRSLYHYLLALGSACWYRFPGRKLYVVAIIGTKGKSTTSELVEAILTAAGYQTALSSTVRFKVGQHSQPNLKKMTMPGRGYVQKFLRQAVQAGCTHAVLEMTSEGARQFRHRFIDLDALIFTNLTPEHLESHGSYDNYVWAKLSIARALEQSPKPDKILVVNIDSAEADKFLRTKVSRKVTYSLNQAESWMKILPGDFNLYNVLAAVTFARALGIKEELIRQAVGNFKGVSGRMEKVGNAPFAVIVDYAHTPESLKQVYETFKNSKLFCVLGGTGGGRDRWKRPVMGALADTYCDRIFLTDEDPYDEPPLEIISAVAAGVKTTNKLEIIPDRRAAIAAAIKIARPGDVVIITGKGTDPYIMGPRGTKLPWDDARVAREELVKHARITRG